MFSFFIEVYAEIFFFFFFNFMEMLHIEPLEHLSFGCFTQTELIQPAAKEMKLYATVCGPCQSAVHHTR